ncbi:uncharacterized protein N7479_005179 [Penicillium vulpinum]|uniref:Zn(2)-C6 fungal-type domain-containing protein n=1 Tax=Penicillium vulpinum TaxID=29845 RepID=A0A1V6RFQ1_9EURO|nr:uncharacterized protein N7479_005179 [Penicillium vulpinum]KAJ5958029.1 hypothetical protein N7479_005179 [Penicillium vulpinum]OQE00299.1 hypothetical protein PENVUL_c054G04590 [Penicillium vulpinum]
MSGGLKSKALQACETCRSLKVRCLPSSQPDTCLKCVNSKRICVFLERRPRPPRQQKPKRSSKARICALESKVDDLLAFANQSQLVRGEGSLQREAGTLENGLSSYSSSSTGEGDSAPSSSHSNRISLNPLNGPHYKWDSYPKINGISCPELLLECGLSIDAADGFLERFRTMSSYFPFFMVPSHATVLKMCKEQPFALVAALAAATSSEKEVQKSLGDKFRTCALHTIMVHNERSLDLLNGVLVYLAWYQFYYIPKKEQFNQLLHIAIGMVDDMGLNLRPAEAMNTKIGLRLTHYRKVLTPSANHDEFFSPEARRAYLGCFYLSSVTGWVKRKSNGVEFQSYMIECARSLGQELEHPTDALLLPLVQLQSMAEVNHCSISAIDNTIRDHMNGLDLEMKVQSFQAEFKQWKESLPLVCQQDNEMNLACEVAVMHVYEMDLVNISAAKMRPKTDSLRDSTSSSFASQTRLEVLFLCLKSAGQLAQNFLSVPTSEYGSLSYIQWSGIIYAISLIYRLTVGISQLPDWDVRVARKTIDFGYILDELCSRFNGVSLCDPAILEDGYLFSVMGPIFENIKQTYSRLKQLPQDASADDTGPVHATSFLTSTLEYPHPCAAFRP